jgi:phosphoglycolate phosphatase
LRQLHELASSDSILFDLDGTLWDASVSATKAWNRGLDAVGLGDRSVTEAELKSFTGIKIEQILRGRYAFMSEVEQKRFLEVFTGFEDEEIGRGGGVLYRDVHAVLSELKKTKRLFIVSNCLKGYIEGFFAFTKLGSYFEGYESSGNTGKAKSGNIGKLIGDFALKRPVYVGDTAHDREACAANGVPFIFASYGFGSVDDPDFAVGRFADLLGILA